MALGVAVPRITQAAMLTYLSGGFYAVADGVSQQGQSGACVSSPFAYACGRGWPNLSLSSYGVSMSTDNPGGGPSNTGVHADFLFRVDNTPGDIQQQGKIYYLLDWWLGANYGFCGTLPLALTINGTSILPGTYIENDWGSSQGSSNGSFDVSIGDIIEFKSYIEGGTDAGFGIFWGQCHGGITLGDFGSVPVPLPPTLLLLVSGLLGLVGWRRYRHG